jgi:ribosomal subunit interface protein
MKLTVTGRQVVISDEDRRHLQARVAHLDRILNDSAVSASCAVSRERQMFICELTVHARGNHMLHAVGKNRILDAAAGLAVAKLAQQAHKLMDRWKQRRRRGTNVTRAAATSVPDTDLRNVGRASLGRRANTDGGAGGGKGATSGQNANSDQSASSAGLDRPPRVIRARAYDAKPMTVADAALVLASSAQPVLVFRHAVSDAVTVLYRRPDGHLGLIEPDR